jgi:hypothetical protein
VSSRRRPGLSILRDRRRSSERLKVISVRLSDLELEELDQLGKALARLDAGAEWPDRYPWRSPGYPARGELVAVAVRALREELGLDRA